MSHLLISFLIFIWLIKFLDSSLFLSLSDSTGSIAHNFIIIYLCLIKICFVRGVANHICAKTMTVLDLNHISALINNVLKILGRVFLPRCILENRRVPAGSLEESKRLKYATVGFVKTATSTAPTQNQ
jgi:hypothetical protein